MKTYNVIKASQYDGEFMFCSTIGSFSDKESAIECAKKELESERLECGFEDDDIYATESNKHNGYFFVMWQYASEKYFFTIRIEEVENPHDEKLCDTAINLAEEIIPALYEQCEKEDKGHDTIAANGKLIDLAIEFEYSVWDKDTDTYRDQLIKFAEENYQRVYDVAAD